MNNPPLYDAFGKRQPAMKSPDNFNQSRVSVGGQFVNGLVQVEIAGLFKVASVAWRVGRLLHPSKLSPALPGLFGRVRLPSSFGGRGRLFQFARPRS